MLWFLQGFLQRAQDKCRFLNILSAQRKVTAVPFFETNPALQPCPPCPWWSSWITQWTRLEREITTFAIGDLSKYFLVKGIVSRWWNVALRPRSRLASDLPGSPSRTNGISTGSSGSTQCWASAGWAGETSVSIKIADVIQVCLYPYWYLVADVILVEHWKSCRLSLCHWSIVGNLNQDLGSVSWTRLEAQPSWKTCPSCSFIQHLPLTEFVLLLLV